MKNFGENVLFSPQHVYTPSTEGEVLALLDRHAAGQIRVRGSLHAWSGAVATEDFLIDLRDFDHVRVEADGAGGYWADVGAGCVLERLVGELERSGFTVPTIGAVTKQTIAGAMSTATHGSGNSSLSHFIEAVRVAGYDLESGRARIFELSEGAALQTARCAVGCMGVILSVRLRIVRQFWVTERISHEASLHDVLAHREEWPLQQFMLLPYAWRYVAFNRKVASQPPGRLARLRSRTYRLYDQLTLELLSHQLLARVLLRFSEGGQPSRILKAFYAHVAPRLIVGPETTAHAVAALTLHSKRHASTRHVEMELFVREDSLADAVRLLTAVTEWSAGGTREFPAEIWADIERCGLSTELSALRGRYMHHYAFIIRRVLADDAFISMTSGGDRYAIGIFTYLPEEERTAYYSFCAFLALAFVRLFDARLHWGKYFPLAVDDIRPLYPQFDAFREQCAHVDARGTFANEYAERVLGLRA